MNYVYFLLGMALGLVIVIYTTTIVKIFGHLDWAERYLGGGGTYLAWKLIGLACIVGSFVALRG